MKTEREKMLCGEFYDTRDHELRALSSNAKDLMRIYNSLPAENTELRSRMIRMLFGACGDNIRVNQPIYVDLWKQYFNRQQLSDQYELYAAGHRQNYNRG